MQTYLQMVFVLANNSSERYKVREVTLWLTAEHRVVGNYSAQDPNSTTLFLVNPTAESARIIIWYIVSWKIFRQLLPVLGSYLFLTWNLDLAVICFSVCLDVPRTRRVAPNDKRREMYGGLNL